VCVHVYYIYTYTYGTNKRGRPHRVDDISEWDRASLQELSRAALDKRKWKDLVKKASDTYGR
jgi:hypothetical protein